jgi:hypothetical protein
MKKIFLYALLAVSVVGNAALLYRFQNPAATSAAGLFGFGGSGSSPSANTKLANGAAAGQTADRGAAAEATSSAADAVPKNARWTSIGSSDLAGLVTRLRAEGFPPAVIRAIISAQLTERFADRRKALIPSDEDTAFWKARGFLGIDTDPKRMAARRELALEQSRMLKELLGPDATAGSDEFASLYQRRQYGTLPRDKVDQLQQISQDYSELAMQIRSEAQGLMLPEDRQKLALLEKEKWKDYAAVLTPDELADFELRTSTTANNMRYQLSAFEPSEQEFRALFPLQKAFDDNFGPNSGRSINGMEAMNQRRDAEKQLIAEAKAVLGEERGAEYERSRDYSYQSVANIAKRLELPKSAALDVWNLQKDIEQRSRALQMNRELTSEARNAQLAALAEEAKAKVTNTLTARGYEAYKQNGGYWLQNIQPRAPGAPSGATTTRVIFQPGG